MGDQRMRTWTVAAFLAATLPCGDAAVAAEDRARICRLQLQRLERDLGDRWAVAQVAAAATTWRALGCANLFGVGRPVPTAASPRDADGVRWILR